ncbi:MAG: VTT domain-containing protein [Anaerolineales bacterium]|nr:VTT domain-containing protein [Anaerolineales bacterium]
MSPSKKANKKASPKKSRGAQKPKGKKTSARSSRVGAAKKPTVRASRRKVRVEPAVESAVNVEVAAKSNIQTNILRVVAFITAVAITLYIYSIRDRVKDFGELGYPGIFLIALLANATVLIPAPGAFVVYSMGAVFNPLLVGLFAGTGGAIGELSGYLAGFSGQAVIERTDIYERTKPWVDKYGGWAILFLSAIPNPFFDAAGIAAGIAKMPLKTFLFFVWIGQLIKMTMFALAGKYSLEWLARFLG